MSGRPRVGEVQRAGAQRQRIHVHAHPDRERQSRQRVGDLCRIDQDGDPDAGPRLAPGWYEAVLRGSITDRAGNRLGTRTWRFRVVPGVIA